MTANTAADLLIDAAILVFILVRQLQVRPVRGSMRLPLILGIIGVVELAQFLGHGHHGAAIIAALLGSLVLAAVTAAIRAATVHIWFDRGRALRQGTWLTAVLWILSLGLHLGYDYLLEGKGSSQAGLGSASLVLYFAVTYAIQRLILMARARRIAGAAQQDAARRDTGIRSGSW